ncbi:MAG: MmcQ/YjbR family DNA-binding protein [Bacteroidia bacterium]|nr:MmcQ/YjbR family DNA-binding protein [Bacteroidia bacterium]
MNIETIRDFCLQLENTSEDMPFGDAVLVFRVHGKIFALLSLSEVRTINLKCEPEKAIELRAQYPEIIPGYHMNKKHWNTLYYEHLSDVFITQLITDAYRLVWNSLPKRLRT